MGLIALKVTLKRERSQASIELLVGIAALLALLLAFLPAISKARGAAEWAIILKQEQTFLKQLVADAKEVHLLGEGNEVTREWRLSAEKTILSFNASSYSLEARFNYEGKQGRIAERIGFEVELSSPGSPSSTRSQISLVKGTHFIKTRNSHGRVVIEEVSS